jgi:hypothetical protein
MEEEYLKRYQYNTIKQIEEKLSEVVGFYNTERPLMICSMFTHDSVHKNNLAVQKQWKTYYKSKNSAVVS